jgi:Domain of unknown function (DUF4148)
MSNMLFKPIFWRLLMNIKHTKRFLLASLLCAATVGGSAWAHDQQATQQVGEEPSYPVKQGSVTAPESRAQVRDETMQARQQGMLISTGDEVQYPKTVEQQSNDSRRSRTDVHAEAIQAAHNHQFTSDYDIGG